MREERIITPETVRAFEEQLRLDEKSAATQQKYRRDLGRFALFAEGRPVTKALTVAYKEQLETQYQAASVNAMLAALNEFLRFSGWGDCCVKALRVQKRAFWPAEKELTRTEYERLLAAAERAGQERLSLIIQTICATGIRVSELQFITVEALARGEAQVKCKGKTRSVFLVPALRKKIRAYARQKHIAAGAVFLSTRGNPLNRSNIWRDMKRLCAFAGVRPEKVFPHNLRHLFARVFYGIEKDIAKLADILGHSSINTTRIYIISTGKEHRKKMEHMRLVI